MTESGESGESKKRYDVSRKAITPTDVDEDRNALRKSIRAFLDREIDRDTVRRIDAEDHVPAWIVERLADQGYTALAFPEEFGGGGGRVSHLLVVVEELTRHSAGVSGAVATSALFGGMNILHSGTDEQRGTYLPAICRGELLCAMGVTEPGSGSDVAGIVTRAVRTERGWRLDGTKMFTSGALEAGLIMVLARTGTEADRHRGLSLMLVPAGTPGLTINKIHKLGNRGVSTTELVLDGVEIDAGAVLGGEEGVNRGFYQVMSTFELERMVLAANSVGIAQAALEDAVRYAGEREQFGQPIGRFQAVAHMLADMATEVAACRAFIYSVAERFESGAPCRADAAMLKLFATERALKVCLSGMQVLGGYGYTPEYDMERHLRDALLGPVGGGTSQIQRNVIADHLGFRV